MKPRPRNHYPPGQVMSAAGYDWGLSSMKFLGLANSGVGAPHSPNPPKHGEQLRYGTAYCSCRPLAV
jgi:hypothetical protein